MDDRPFECVSCKRYFGSTEVFALGSAALCYQCVRDLERKRYDQTLDACEVECSFCEDILPIPMPHQVIGFSLAGKSICFDCLEFMFELQQKR